MEFDVETDHHAELLLVAAAHLSSASDRLIEARRPPTCSTCGVKATGVRATLQGRTALFPCGHEAQSG